MDQSKLQVPLALQGHLKKKITYKDVSAEMEWRALSIGYCYCVTSFEIL